MLKIRNFSISLEEESQLEDLFSKKTWIKKADIKEFKILQRSVDARRTDNITLIYTIGIVGHSSDKILQKSLKPRTQSEIVDLKNDHLFFSVGNLEMQHRPLIVGMGPAGIFAALYLARKGYRPILLERGKAVEERSLDVANFWNGSAPILPQSNVQFGEGGAGTFSDGKLTARSKDPRTFFILKDLVDAGAPEDILYQNKPHVGTDVLRRVLINLRKELLSLGAEIYFEEQLTEVTVREGKLAQVKTSKGRELGVDALVLAIGHSARDTYKMLHDSSVKMESKAFAVGLRIEHPQEWLDKAQYGKSAGHPALGSADYMLSHKSSNDRSVYTFCMCPGGEVVASTSEEGCVVVNGMSFRSRNSGIANSAIVASVTPEDWDNEVLGGVEFQRTWEKKAFELGGSNYFAPIQTVGEFLGTGTKEQLLCDPSYRPGVNEADLKIVLPEPIITSIQEGISAFGHKIKGFDHPGAILTGVETRTSSPVRILRNEAGESISTKGLYPTGEGAGYAGGIVSAAMDGIKQAENIMKIYKPLK